MKDWFSWNGVRCTEYGIHVTAQPSIIRPSERVTFTNIPGRPGSLTTLEADDVYDEPGHKWRSAPKHIAAYTLRDEYDSVRRAGGELSLFKVPKELWRTLPPDAVYLLDGERVPGSSFQFIDGLILRTLEIYTDSATMARYGAGRGVVIGDIYPDRVPLVVFNGAFSSIESWLKMCRADAFSVSADVPMHYFYMLPVEAVQTYGVRGKYGAICIDIVE